MKVFLDGMLWGTVLGAAIATTLVVGYYNHAYEDYGYVPPVKKVYYRDTNLVSVAKAHLHKHYGYVKFRAIQNHHCYDQILDKMLLRSNWEDPVCYDLFGKTVQDFIKGPTNEKR